MQLAFRVLMIYPEPKQDFRQEQVLALTLYLTFLYLFAIRQHCSHINNQPGNLTVEHCALKFYLSMIFELVVGGIPMAMFKRNHTHPNLLFDTED